MDTPETRFTWVGDDRISYQVFGEGPPDLLFVTTFFETVDVRWEWPPYAHFLRGLTSFSRVITFDRRGTGASDRVSRDGLPVWEDWADDARAVLDAVGSERAAVFGLTDAGTIAILFAAAEPKRTQALVLFNSTARTAVEEDYPWGLPVDRIAEAQDYLVQIWGTEETAAFAAPRAAQDPAFRRWFAKMQRAASSARDVAATMRTVTSADVRQILPAVRTPTLVIHQSDYPWSPLEQGRYLADHLGDARLLVVPGSDPLPFGDAVEQILQEMETFLTGTSGTAVSGDRILAAVLFTDIVGSTERVAALGDRRWQTLLESHDTITRGVIEQNDGRLVKFTGDGVLATFDGPGRAVRCAVSLRDALRTLAIEIRAGIHTGEVEVHADDLGGIGVHIAARVMEHANAGEIIVSGAVPMLMAGSGIEFEPRGDWTLKGVPGQWPLFEMKS